MKALSIRQPWAWLILHAGKDVENREWPTRFRGRFLIHASKGMTSDEYFDVAYQLYGKIVLPPFDKLERGGIVGSAELVACINDGASEWFYGPYGFILRDPTPLPFRPYKGQLGFFEVPDEAPVCR